jgi:hypothetical protein
VADRTMLGKVIHWKNQSGRDGWLLLVSPERQAISWIGCDVPGEPNSLCM